MSDDFFSESDHTLVSYDIDKLIFSQILVRPKNDSQGQFYNVFRSP